jgi:adenine-specific DNA methylase
LTRSVPAEFRSEASVAENSAKPADIEMSTYDIFITDPPYGDAVKYEEILEFFIAWLRKNPAYLSSLIGFGTAVARWPSRAKTKTFGVAWLPPTSA